MYTIIIPSPSISCSKTAKIRARIELAWRAQKRNTDTDTGRPGGGKARSWARRWRKKLGVRRKKLRIRDDILLAEMRSKAGAFGPILHNTNSENETELRSPSETETSENETDELARRNRVELARRDRELRKRDRFKLRKRNRFELVRRDRELRKRDRFELARRDRFELALFKNKEGETDLSSPGETDLSSPGETESSENETDLSSPGELESGSFSERKK